MFWGGAQNMLNFSLVCSSPLSWPLLTSAYLSKVHVLFKEIIYNDFAF